MYKEQIDAYIDSKREDMLSDLSELVRIDSQKGETKEGKPFGEGPARVLELAADMMSRYGLRVRNYENYVAAGDYGPEPRELDILAHLDVVPVSDDWKVTKPFEPLIRDGRIYGRGTCDDKGPAIAALYAIRAIKDLGIPIKKGVRLILGSDEECGSSDLTYYYGIEPEAPWSFTPDADYPVINLEKARLAKVFTAKLADGAELPALVSLEAGSKVNVVPAKAEAGVKGLSAGQIQAIADEVSRRTRVEFAVSEEDGCLSISAKGLSAHGSLPELGNNALTALLELLAELPLAEGATKAAIHYLHRMFPHGDTTGKAVGIAMSDELSGALSMNLGIMRIRDGHLSGEFDVRAPLCATDENLTKVLKDVFAEGQIEMEEGSMTPAHYVPADSPLVSALLESYTRYTGKPGRALSTGGGTYVHHLERGVAFGCMVEEVDNHMHGDDEFMEIDNLMMSAKIFADAIVRLCC